MIASKQIAPGMILSIRGTLFRVESSVKVTVTKGNPFIKTKLKALDTEKLVEKNFKPDQEVDVVTRSERMLEFLYPDGKEYRFLDIDTLEQLSVSPQVVGDTINYLKEGIHVNATLYGETVFAVELPQFLELMVMETVGEDGGKMAVANMTKIAALETGAQLEVPMFVEAGDIVKVDTTTEEFIQRV
jgi:elongation factor P